TRIQNAIVVHLDPIALLLASRVREQPVLSRPPLRFSTECGETVVYRQSIRLALHQLMTRWRITEALVPPKPKELDSTTLISRLRAVCGTRSIPVCTDGLSRLMVGGAMLSRMARMEKSASIAPAAPRRCPVEDLVADIDTLDAALPSSRSTAPSSISSPTCVEVPCALM